MTLNEGLKEIRARRFNLVTITNCDGDEMQIFVEKVKNTYTVKIDNTSKLNEYGNYTRIYYNYGLDLREVKDRVKRYAA